MGVEGEDENIPLLAEHPKASGELEGHHRERTGTLWTTVAHIITAVVGVGVLSLAWSVAQLGWVAGPIAMMVFAAITLFQSSLMADCYRSPDSEHGRIINRSYMDAVRLYLGEKSQWVCGLFQQTGLYGGAIAYTITAATSMRAILKSNCYHKEGHNDPCSFDDGFYMLLFGAAQIIVSQIPDLQSMVWLSILAAVMSFSYASIGVALGIAKLIANGRIQGGIGGVPLPPAQKVWRVSQALGDIAYAYPYSTVLLEIQDTLKSPPPENQTMKRASVISVFITAFLNLGCGCFGYAAFGNVTPGNLLTGFGSYEPYWLVGLANACVAVHLLGGYQVKSQPIFSFADGWFAMKFPNRGFVNNFYTIQLPFLPAYRLNLLRLCFRTTYVISTTALAMLFPYFNPVLGLLGAFVFWPLAIFFPVEMYIVQRKIGAWTKKWVCLQIFSIGCLLLSLFAFVGSLEGVLREKLG